MKADDRHFSLVADLIRRGRVIPFFGAGANLCDRPDDAAWEPGWFTPSGGELAVTLAERSYFPEKDASDLARVSQYADATLGEGGLYDVLHEVFDADYAPTSLHRLFARVPELLRVPRAPSRAPVPQLLILTTNYDDLAERALTDEGEPFDVVWYEAKQRAAARGRFIHRAPDGEIFEVAPANKYTGLDPAQRPVILKLHGAIDRDDPRRDSYVITEDSYIDYLAGGDVGEQIPFSVRARMADSYFLFLGYSMRDWNLRLLLHRLWGDQPLTYRSWAVQEEAKPLEREFWRRRDVDVLEAPFEQCVAALASHAGLEPIGAAT